LDYIVDTDHLRALQEPLAGGIVLQRDHVELFFKWIWQHRRIKGFFGTSGNGVKTQSWILVSVCGLVAIVKKRFNLNA
jgi:hypothetical protein